MSHFHYTKVRDHLLYSVNAPHPGGLVEFGAYCEDEETPSRVFLPWDEALPLIREMDTSPNGSGTAVFQATIQIRPRRLGRPGE